MLNTARLRVAIMGFACLGLLSFTASMSAFCESASSETEHETLAQSFAGAVAKAESPSQRIYFEFCKDFLDAQESNEPASYQEIVNHVITYAAANVSDSYGAKCYTLAGDIYMEGLNDAQSSIKWHKVAVAALKSLGDIDGAVYSMLRIGDAYVNVGDRSTAIATWKEGFMLGPDTPTALQQATKTVVVSSHEEDKSVTLCEAKEFMDQAIELRKEKKAKGRLELDRLFLLYNMHSSQIIEREALVEEITDLLNRYPEGKDEYIDNERSQMTTFLESISIN